MKRLKELLIAYYNCGYYDYRYRKYLKQGKLRKRLSKVYSDEQIDLTLNYLEGKQKVAVSKRVNDIEELKRLKELLLVYYNCGYYSDRYSKYLEKGKLRIKLSKTFSEDQIDLTIKHLEGKGKVLKN